MKLTKQAPAAAQTEARFVHTWGLLVTKRFSVQKSVGMSSKWLANQRNPIEMRGLVCS